MIIMQSVSVDLH